MYFLKVLERPGEHLVQVNESSIYRGYMNLKPSDDMEQKDHILLRGYLRHPGMIWVYYSVV